MVDGSSEGTEVTVYPNQPRPQDGWPAQPPRQTPGPGDGPEYRQGGDQPYPTAAPGRPPGRRRGRAWIVLLGVLVVLVVAAVIGDQVARAYAQNMIANKVESSSGMSVKPSVSIPGFPFLTQVAAHEIGTINLSASNVREGRLDISSIKATATGVHLSSGFNSATIDQISGTALIPFASLVNATGAHGITISADPAAGPDAANVSAGPLTATARIVQTGPSRITIRMEELNGIAGTLIGSLPNYTFDVPKLPAGLQVQRVTVTSQGISIAATAHDTTFTQ